MFEKINTDIKENINLELELVSSDNLFLDKLKEILGDDGVVVQ